MYIADWRKPGGPGVFPLQHHGFTQASNGNTNWTLQMRASMVAVRIVGREDTSGGLGDWVEDEGTRGDINGAMFWPKSSREISGWFPSAVPVITNTGTGTMGGGETFAEPGILPILGSANARGVQPDRRWTQIDPRMPHVRNRDNQRLYSKFPIGTLGIGMVGTDENTQVELMMHTDPRLVAPNVRGDGICGTIVSDMASNGRYDPDRYARLQTMMRVILPRVACIGLAADPERPGKSLNTIAWNLAMTGRESALGRGAVIDNAWGGGGGGTPTGDGGGLL